MRPGRVLSWLALGSILILISVGIATAHHSYHLTVHQLMSGLQKAGSPDKKGFVLVDVRTAQEHFSGMIPGTDMNIDYEVIKERHREIGAGLEDHIVVYCQSGHRSNIAAEALADLGYKHVYNVEGSMNAWMAAGFRVAPPGR